MSENSTGLGRRIAQARREQRLTQSELAERLNVSPRSIHAYESGKVIPYRRLAAIGEALDRPTRWLLNGTLDDAAPPLEDVVHELRALRDEVRSLSDALRGLAANIRAAQFR